MIFIALDKQKIQATIDITQKIVGPILVNPFVESYDLSEAINVPRFCAAGGVRIKFAAMSHPFELKQNVNAVKEI